MAKALAKKIPTPKAVPKNLVCDTCGEDWDLHPEDATVMDCLEIAKSKQVRPACVHHYHTCWCYHQWTYTPWWNTQTITVDSGTATWDNTTSVIDVSNTDTKQLTHTAA